MRYEHVTIAAGTIAGEPPTGFGCGLCLDFGHLVDLGPCPRCRPDAALAWALVLLNSDRRGEDGTGWPGEA